MPEGYNAEFETHLYSALGNLLYCVADNEGQDALALILFDDWYKLRGIVCLSDNHSYAGNISGYEGNAQASDDWIGNKAYAGLVFVWILRGNILQRFDYLRTNRCRKSRVQRFAEILFV